MRHSQVFVGMTQRNYTLMITSHGIGKAAVCRTKQSSKGPFSVGIVFRWICFLFLTLQCFPGSPGKEKWAHAAVGFPEFHIWGVRGTAWGIAKWHEDIPLKERISLEILEISNTGSIFSEIPVISTVHGPWSRQSRSSIEKGLLSGPSGLSGDSGGEPGTTREEPHSRTGPRVRWRVRSKGFMLGRRWGSRTGGSGGSVFFLGYVDFCLVDRLRGNIDPSKLTC